MVDGQRCPASFSRVLCWGSRALDRTLLQISTFEKPVIGARPVAAAAALYFLLP